IFVLRENLGVWSIESRVESLAEERSLGRAIAFDGTTILGYMYENDFDTPRGIGRPVATRVRVFRELGGVWSEEARLHSLMGVGGSALGDAFALDPGRPNTIRGTRSLVGAPGYGEPQPGVGAAFVMEETHGFTGTDSRVRYRLEADDLSAGDAFGSAVAARGDLFVVGAPGDDDLGMDSGSVYLFREQQAPEPSDMVYPGVAKLLAPDGTAGDAFGSALAVDGRSVAVGAPGAQTAYVFREDSTGFDLYGAVTPPAAAGDGAGSAVAVLHNWLFIAAPGDDEAGLDAGAVYVYQGRDPGGWMLVHKLLGTAAGDRFGTAVAATSTTRGQLAVGAPGDDGAAPDAGAVHVFGLDPSLGWVSEQVLRASVPSVGAGMGAALDLRSEVGNVLQLAAGAPDDAAGAGALWVFQRVAGSWQEAFEQRAYDATPGARFGASVAIGEGMAYAWAPGHDFLETDAGSGYVLRHRDIDGDGVLFEDDNCPVVFNPGQEGSSPSVPGDACKDPDGDGVSLLDDNCADLANPDQRDGDGDGLGDLCDDDSDQDGDGVGNVTDNCPHLYNPDQEDWNGSGPGDACDPHRDDDDDGLGNDVDNCPLYPNPLQRDFDLDGEGDACEPHRDFDSDGYPNDTDNCPVDANPDQADFDGNGVGDVCDDTDCSDGVDNDGDGQIDMDDSGCATPGFHYEDPPFLTRVLEGDDAEGGDYFGYDVAIDGNFAVIGAYSDNDQGAYSGGARVYERVAGVWQERAVLRVPEAHAWPRAHL
ncbi:MAG: thrombospondin type 3 repeat-containing protein, partial [Planctomycetota bacterium]